MQRSIKDVFMKNLFITSIIFFVSQSSFATYIDHDVQNEVFSDSGCVTKDGEISKQRISNDQVCIGDVIILPTGGCYQSDGFKTYVYGINSTDLSLGFRGSSHGQYLISINTVFDEVCGYTHILKN